MKLRSYFLTTVFLYTISASSSAQETSSMETEILATRGNAQVTQDMFEARAAMIPKDVRYEALRDGSRFQELVNLMLIRSQLAQDARDAGFDKLPGTVAQMNLAADDRLADAWLQNYVETQPEADYEQMAREYYALNQEEFRTEERYDASHILISTKERSPEEALTVADTVWRKLQESPDSFDQLVMEYSEDPSAAANNGKFKKVRKGQMVKPFEEAALALEIGQVSEPVSTSFGYHIIRLDGLIPSAIKPLEELLPQLMLTEKERHQGRLRNDYLKRISSEEMQLSEASMREMIKRVFGEEYLNSPEEGPETE